MQVKDGVASSGESGRPGTETRPRVSTKSNNKRKNSSRLKKLAEALVDVERERDELKDMLLRKAADFDNYKKRTDSEQMRLIANANADLITELLPVYDDIERSMAAAKGKSDFASLVAGLELIFKNFSKTLDGYGVKPIPAIGEEFDPEKHDALMQVESDGHAPGMVVDEHKKGYLLNEKVLRHSQVLVSK